MTFYIREFEKIWNDITSISLPPLKFQIVFRMNKPGIKIIYLFESENN